jgi:tRNA-modifying protein YgfZ
MAIPSPLEEMFADAGVSLVPFGAAPSMGEAEVAHLPKLAPTVEALELEYAALRKSCVLIDEPHRALIEVKGAERVEFLNRMLTQDLKTMERFGVRRSFWLNRKGRIDADLVVVMLEDRVLLDVAAFSASATVASLSGYVITEEVTIKDISAAWHRMTLHGPTAMPLLASLVEAVDDGGPRAGALEPMQACLGRPQGSMGGDGSLAPASVLFREDLAGVPGVSMWTPVEASPEIFQRAIEMGHSHAHPGRAPLPIVGQGGNVGVRAELGRTINDSIRLRLSGWHAFNIARVEAGVPLFLLDFGPDSLPHETGVLRDRVSFKKGCYLGQEVVARMDSRGHSKSTHVRVKALETYAGELDQRPMPEAGARIWAEGASEAEPIGRVTSSVLSPLRGSQPIALASVKPAGAGVGTRLRVECAGTASGSIVMVVEE